MPPRGSERPGTHRGRGHSCIVECRPVPASPKSHERSPEVIGLLPWAPRLTAARARAYNNQRTQDVARGRGLSPDFGRRPGVTARGRAAYSPLHRNRNNP
jgi:hypothetical protein